MSWKRERLTRDGLEQRLSQSERSDQGQVVSRSSLSLERVVTSTLLLGCLSGVRCLVFGGNGVHVHVVYAFTVLPKQLFAKTHQDGHQTADMYARVMENSTGGAVRLELIFGRLAGRAATARSGRDASPERSAGSAHRIFGRSAV